MKGLQGYWNKVAVVLLVKLNLNCPIKKKKKNFICVSSVVKNEIKYSKEICNVDVKYS